MDKETKLGLFKSLLLARVFEAKKNGYTIEVAMQYTTDFGETVFSFANNINTHEAENLGVPLIGQMLPEFNLDTVRGKLVGAGAK